MSGCSIDENAVCTTAWIYLRISDNGRAHKAVEEPPRKTDGRTDNALRVPCRVPAQPTDICLPALADLHTAQDLAMENSLSSLEA